MSLAKQMYYNRKLSNLTQEEAAKKINLTLEEYQQYESGKRLRDDYLVEQLAKTMNVTPEFITDCSSEFD